MAVKLELYRVFKEVAETGNISVAAKNLYISQSAGNGAPGQTVFPQSPGRFSDRRGADALRLCP